MVTLVVFELTNHGQNIKKKKFKSTLLLGFFFVEFYCFCISIIYKEKTELYRCVTTY